MCVFPAVITWATVATFSGASSEIRTMNIISKIVSLDLARCAPLAEKYQEVLKSQNGVDGVAYQTVERLTNLWSDFAKYG